jgi:hypothetical protein
MRYRISIHADGFRYRTAGAIAINASQRPMIDAARALLAHGAEPSSTLEGRWERALVGPATLASITKVRRAPRSDLPMSVLNAA